MSILISFRISYPYFTIVPFFRKRSILRDAMYANASLHREDGSWQMIFGVNTLPQYRRQGRAAKLLQHAAGDARKHGRKGCVLTCKAPLVHFYESLGYQNEGVSASTHGGAVWYHMRLAF